MNQSTMQRTSVLDGAREGMIVVDATDTRLGSVKRLRRPTPGNGTEDLPKVSDPLRTRLERFGFIELQDSELHGDDAYVPGDRIAEVTGDTIRLRPQGTESAAMSGSGSASHEPMFRTRLGTPNYVVHPQGDMRRRALWIAGAATPVVGGAAGFWLYRRRKRRNRLDARARRMLERLTARLPENRLARLGGVGVAVMLLLVLRRLVTRSSDASAIVPPDFDAAPMRRLRERTQLGSRGVPFGVILAVLAAGLGIALWRRRTPERPAYIGTPGVESASGRDRVRSGELPAEYGSEHPFSAR